MSTSDQLRKHQLQHAPKNTLSKKDDKEIYQAMHDTIKYLEGRFNKNLQGYNLAFQDKISFEQLIQLIKYSGLRKEFDMTFANRAIQPDGGVILLGKQDEPEFMRLVLIAEVKRQGTNKKRIAEGKKKQAQGNAIERLGKNLIGIKSALNHESITPFVCFGHGCDFNEDYDENDFVMSKISMLNEFYPLNKIYVFKRDGDSNKNRFAPVSMYFREDDWTKEEMFEVLKEIGETSIRYYLF